MYEPTGGYERLLATLLAEARVPARRVHPNKVRAYARACGQQAKTDRMDAQVLSRYAAAFDLTPDSSPETDDAGLRAQLKDLLRRRDQLVAQRTADKNRLDKGQSEEALASAERHIAWLHAEIARLEKACRSLLRSSPALSELGRIDGKSAAALVGLAPCSRDSGRQRGRRSIQGGRGKVRRVLYMAAQSAARHHAGLREFYRGLRAQGKSGKVVLMAVMRKLVMQLNAIAVRGTPWAPSPAHILPQAARKPLDSRHRYSCESRNPSASVSGIALLQRAILAPAPAEMMKIGLLDTCQTNLTTHPRWHDGMCSGF